jgi:hypothetical protein
MDAIATRESPKTSAPATAVAHAWLRYPIYQELRLLAAGRRLHVDAYVADIVTAAVLLGLTDELIERAKRSLPS